MQDASDLSWRYDYRSHYGGQGALGRPIRIASRHRWSATDGWLIAHPKERDHKVSARGERKGKSSDWSSLPHRSAPSCKVGRPELAE